MSDCLSGKTTSAKTLTPQQQKMKDCNVAATAKDLKGDARKTFMSSCLKGS
jgi:psiF repeat